MASGFQWHRGWFRLAIKKKKKKKGCQALEQASQGSGQVTIPGSVQNARG